MLHFKSPQDLLQLSPEHSAYPIVSDLVQRIIVDYQSEGCTYAPEDDGWIALVEPCDLDRSLTDIWPDGGYLTDLLWEGFTRQDGHYVGVYLANNQWGLVVVVPDAPWINGALRNVIEDNLDP